MQVYQMRPIQIQYIKPPCRKSGEIKPVGSAIPFGVWLALLFVSFVFSGLFITKMVINSYLYVYTDLMQMVDAKSLYYLTLLFVAGFEILILYLQIYIYNFIARRYLQGALPCSMKELFRNLVPFFVLRNTIWGALSLLMFLEGGKFVSIGLASFEMIATLIIIMPAFFAIKKRYINQGYSKDILQAYVVPYTIIQAIFLIV